MRQKASELQSREDNLARIEDELKQRLDEAGRQISRKDEELLDLKHRYEADRQ